MRPPPGAAAGTLKSPQDWLTEADGAVEDFLSRELAAAFPEDGFRGEEAGVARPGALTWVLDPIDGTSNFARGRSRWCVSLGLLEDRSPLLGLIAAPALGELFAARAGHGATLNERPIQAARTERLDRAMIECGWSPRTPTPRYLELAGRVMAAGAMLRAGGSGAMALADVACGRLDGYVEPHINLWDVAGALPLLAEAGAFEAGFMAGGGPVRGGPIVAAAPLLAESLLGTIDFTNL
jgi:myo-inositol-1(or 4)-monophosphatase